MFAPLSKIEPSLRRFPHLMGKVLKRDANVMSKLTFIWGQVTENNADEMRQKLFDMYLKEVKALSDERYWELLHTIWLLCGTDERVPKFRELFRSGRPERYCFMTKGEAKKLRIMEFPVRVFQAADKAGAIMSWSTDLNFTQLYKEKNQKEFIFHRDIEYRHEIFALIDRGGDEEEIIIL